MNKGYDCLNLKMLGYCLNAPELAPGQLGKCVVCGRKFGSEEPQIKQLTVEEVTYQRVKRAVKELLHNDFNQLFPGGLQLMAKGLVQERVAKAIDNHLPTGGLEQMVSNQVSKRIQAYTQSYAPGGSSGIKDFKKLVETSIQKEAEAQVRALVEKQLLINIAFVPLEETPG